MLPGSAPTLYKHEDEDRELNKILHDPKAKDAARISVLLANKQFPRRRRSRTLLWAMYACFQQEPCSLPHRHQSVALDLIIDCQPGCYSLVGEDLDGEGKIVKPFRAGLENRFWIRDAAGLVACPLLTNPAQTLISCRSRTPVCKPICEVWTFASSTQITSRIFLCAAELPGPCNPRALQSISGG